MTYGTLEYWKRQADQLGRQNARQDQQIQALWGRLVAVETIAASKGVDVNDPELVQHSMEMAALDAAVHPAMDDLETMRRTVATVAFEAVDAVTKGRSKADMFDWLIKRLSAANRAVHKRNHLEIAREQVAARRKAWADLDAQRPLFEADQ